MEQFKRYLLTLNIFKKSSGSHQEVNEDLYEQRTQVVATRVYFLLLILILFILLFITCKNSTTITVTVANPTFAQIQNLPSNRTCPCARTSFSYDKFVSSNVSFHQVCSSDFVSDRWISSLFHGINTSYFLPNDIRSIGFAEFQALANFCRLSQANAKQTLRQFGSSLFISLYFDSSPENLRLKVITTFNRFNSSMPTAFTSRIELISAIIISNNLLNALGTSIIPNMNTRTILNKDKLIEYWILQYWHRSSTADCRCIQAETLTNEDCRGLSGIYEEYFDFDTDCVNPDSSQDPYEPTIPIPEFASSCMPADACLLSSLECFFNQSCVNTILLYQRITDGMMWNFTALDSNKTLKPSRFNITSRIKSIVDELMVEEWLTQEDYDKYFQQCAPVLCTYYTNIHPDFLDVLNIFIGLLGGLCSALDLVVLPVVRFIRRRLWPPPMNTQPSQGSRISGK